MSQVKILIFVLLTFFFCQKSINAQIKIEIDNGHSLSRLETPHLLPPKGDQKMALPFYNALVSKNVDSLKLIGNYYYNLSKEANTIQNDYASFYWLIKNITADKKVLENGLNEPLATYIFNFLTENNFERLKNYLVVHYNLNFNMTDNDKSSIIGDHAYLLRYNTPIRDNWERASEILSFLPLKKGDKVIDVGCGFGYYTFKLSQVVGNEGKVFATEIKENYIDFLNTVNEKSGTKNVFPLITSPDYIGVNDSVDAVFMCELYHDIYGRMADDKRENLLNSMKHVLKMGGCLIIAENLNLNNKDLIKPYIDKRLIIAQLAYWGFSLIDDKSFPPYRYVLIFKHTNQKFEKQTLNAENKTNDTSFFIMVNSRKSIVRFTMPTIYDITPNGKKAARLAYSFFETGRSDSAIRAIALYDSILPLENLGGEYGAVQWLCKIKNTPDEKRDSLFKQDLLSKSFYSTMTHNNNYLVKYYLINKYHLFDKKSGISDSLLEKRFAFNKAELLFLENYITDLNPIREKWDKSNLIVENLKIEKGCIIADLGSSSGYYAYRFSKDVGNEGKVYSIDFMSKQRKEFERFVNEQQISNIQLIASEPDSFSIKEKADIVFMSCFYARLYGYIKIDMEIFIKNISNNLKTNGKLIIVENGPVADGLMPGRGPFIAKELIEYQLAFYGFELTNDTQMTPQQYMLTFIKKGEK